MSDSNTAMPETEALIWLLRRHAGTWAICFLPAIEPDQRGSYVAFRSLAEIHRGLGLIESLASHCPRDLDDRIRCQNLLTRGVEYMTGQSVKVALMAEDLIDGLEQLVYGSRP